MLTEKLMQGSLTSVTYSKVYMLRSAVKMADQLCVKWEVWEMKAVMESTLSIVKLILSKDCCVLKVCHLNKFGILRKWKHFLWKKKNKLPNLIHKHWIVDCFWGKEQKVLYVDTLSLISFLETTNFGKI